jgi:hypothetical protein
MTHPAELAQIGYDAYCAAVGGKAFNGDDLPTFYAVPQYIRDAWIESAAAVADRVREEKAR